jgi:pimeloyl-ACP methyl ester carboxylesterase
MKSFALEHGLGSLRFHDLPGHGTPILFLHGLGCASSCDYPRIASDSAMLGRRVLLLDLLGSGFSDRPDHFGYGIEDHARTVVELIQGLALPEIDLFGHSMGGSIAIVTASLLSQNVRRLVLSEPNLDAGGGFFSRAIAAPNENEYITSGHANVIQSESARGGSIWAGSLAVSSPVAMHRAATSLVRGGKPSWREQLAALSMPKTVIFGEQSLPDPDTARLADIDVTVRVVPNAGHSMAWENPSGLADVIAQALA